MRMLTAVLLFLATTAYAEHAGRGLVRHSSPGMGNPTPIAEIVELDRVVTHPALVEARFAPAPVAVVAPAASAPTFIPPVFCDVAKALPEPVSKPPEAKPTEANPVEVKPVETTPARDPFAVARAEILDEEHAVAAQKRQELVHPEKVETAAPTAEQLQMMRDFHLSSPPTILNADHSVRAAGHNSQGAAVSAPTAPYFIQPYCPECQLRRRGY